VGGRLYGTVLPARYLTFLHLTLLDLTLRDVTSKDVMLRDATLTDVTLTGAGQIHCPVLTHRYRKGSVSLCTL